MFQVPMGQSGVFQFINNLNLDVAKENCESENLMQRFKCYL